MTSAKRPDPAAKACLCTGVEWFTIINAHEATNIDRRRDNQEADVRVRDAPPDRFGGGDGSETGRTLIMLNLGFCS